MKLKDKLSTANQTKKARYGQRVNAMIRERYTLSDELALLRRREDVPDAFATYTAYAEECKERARREEEDA